MIDIIDLQNEIDTKKISALIKNSWEKKKVIHLTGIPKKIFGNPDDLRLFYDELISHLGEPVNLGEDISLGDRSSQRSGQRWMEIRYDPKVKDAYRYSSNAQPLHTDGSYISSFPNASFIYCQASASNGGETVFIDLKDIIDILIYEKPDLYKVITSQIIAHERSGDKRIAKIISNDGALAKIHWNYYCVSKNISDELKDVCEELFNFLNSSVKIKDKLIPVALKPGEGVFWKDDETLHGRNSYKAEMTSERFLWKTALEIIN